LHALKRPDGFLAGINKAQALGIELKNAHKEYNEERKRNESLNECCACEVRLGFNTLHFQ
jgi:hypothetical protein